MSGMMSIGISGLNAASVNLATVSHNITNADTEGYSRQRAVQASNIAISSGSGFIGQGTHVETVERMYSSFLVESLNSAQTTASSLDSYYTEISKIDNMLSEDNAGLATAIDSFFTGVSDAATNPSESSSRQSMISSAQALVSRYQALDGQLDTLYDGVNTQITSTVDSINTYATQIASLNQQIVKAQSANNQPANDLLDQRDQLVADLNELVGVTTTTNTNGSYNVFFGTGQQLVVGTHVTKLAAEQSSADSSRLTLYTVASNGDTELPESLITGGALGGLLSYRSETLDKASDELGANATALALTFNAQYALGQDANGAVDGDTGFERDFFEFPNPVTAIANSTNDDPDTVVSVTLSQPTYVDGEFTTYLTGSDYQLSKNGGNLTLTRLSDNTTFPTSGTVSDIDSLNTWLAENDPQGFEISATAEPADGDSYLIEPTRGAAGEITVNAVIAADTDLITTAAPIRTATGTGNTGTATISEGSIVPVASVSVADSANPRYVALDDDYPLVLTYSYDSASSTGTISWDATTAADGSTIAGGSVTYASGDTITILKDQSDSTSLGVASLVISGTPSDGDTFTISRNTSATNDSRNASALAGLQTAKTMNGGWVWNDTDSKYEAASGSDTFETNYASLVSYIGNQTNQIKVTQSAQDSLVTQASDAVDALSGVNLDEEAADLIKYQEAYQACAKVISTASDLFDTILAINS